MNKERLLKLADYLEKRRDTKKKKFDFSTLIQVRINTRSEHVCGTVGCAIGELPYVFPELCRYDVVPKATIRCEAKMSMDAHHEVEIGSSVLGRKSLMREALLKDTQRYTDYPGHLNDFKVAEVLFGLTEKQTHSLFQFREYSCDGYTGVHRAEDVTPRMVAAKIRRLVRERSQKFVTAA